MLHQRARPAEHREKGREQTGARRARRINPDPPRAEIWRALGVPGLADASGQGPDAVRQVAPEMKAVFVPVLQGIGAKVVYTSRQRVADSPIRFLPLTELLPVVDVLSLHLPLTPGRRQE